MDTTTYGFSPAVALEALVKQCFDLDQVSRDHFLALRHERLLKREPFGLKHRPNGLAKVGEVLPPLDFFRFTKADRFLTDFRRVTHFPAIRRCRRL